MPSIRSLMLAAGLFSTAISQAVAAPDLARLVSPIKSFRSVITVQQVNMNELVKIRKDYAQSYRVKTSNVSYQYPNHVKIDGKVGPMSVIYIIIGNTKVIKYGPVRRQKNLVEDPGQKQGLLDFGILTSDQLNDYNWRHLRQEGPLQVYELRFKNNREDTSRRVIWVDPVRKVVVRRQIFHQRRDNDLKMETRHEGLRQVSPGVWVPTVVKVFNDQGKLGASSQITNITINRPIPLSAFRI